MHRLTVRQNEIMALLADGLTDRGIAVRLNISHNTVAIHLNTIYRKLGIGSRAEATAAYVRDGGGANDNEWY